MIVRVEVTQADIDAGVPQTVDERHPIAKAVRRALGWPQGRGSIGVASNWIDIHPTGPDHRRTFDAFGCADFIRDFDAGRPVYPFCFWFQRDGSP